VAAPIVLDYLERLGEDVIGSDLKTRFMDQAMRKISCFVVFSVFGFILTAGAADWPQWRGPDRDGISQEKGLLQEWPEEGPKLLWQQKDLGDGYSTPAIADGHIFLINNKGLEDEYVQALDEKDGKPIWHTHLGKVGNPDQKPSYPGARSTPTVDGKLVYALGSDGDLACVDAAKGEIKWQKSLRNDFGGKPGTWAYAESPLVDGETLVVTPGGKEATIVALNKQNGDVIWKSEVPDGDAAGYSSVIVVNAAGVKQYVQFVAKGLVGVDAKTGKFLWRYDHTAQGSPANIATPVAAGEFVYSCTKYSGAGLVKLSTDNGGVKAEEVYYDRKLPKAIGGAVLIGEYLYGTGGELTQCVDFKTGEVKWTKERAVSPASICFADGRLYLHGEKEGDLVLLEATPDAYREVGHFTPPDVPSKRVGMAWEYPVVSDGKLYLHDWGTLWCYDVKAPDGKRAASRTTTSTRPIRN
jgi:outer membrane protein assembly factor BamB